MGRNTAETLVWTAPQPVGMLHGGEGKFLLRCAVLRCHIGHRAVLCRGDHLEPAAECRIHHQFREVHPDPGPGQRVADRQHPQRVEAETDQVRLLGQAGDLRRVQRQFLGEAFSQPWGIDHRSVSSVA